MARDREDWVDKDSSARIMSRWPDWKLRWAYSMFRPEGWTGSDKDYEQWKCDIMEDSFATCFEILAEEERACKNDSTFFPLDRARRQLEGE